MSSDDNNKNDDHIGPWGRPGHSDHESGKQVPPEKAGGGPDQNHDSPWGKPQDRPSGGANRGGNMPPDMDMWMRRGQDHLKNAMNGSGKSGKNIALALVGCAALWFSTGFYRVEPDQQGVVMRFGKWVRTAEPGLRYHLPAPVEQVLLPRVTSENLMQIGFRGEPTSVMSNRRSSGADPRDIPEESIMLTGDENIINIDFVIKWRIDNAANFLFRIREPEQTIKRAAESAMREVIARTNIQPALTGARESIQDQTRQILQNMLNEYEAGVLITGVELLNVQVPTQVVDAFDDVQRAAQDRQRLQNEAETYRNSIIPEARGQVERMAQEAQAYREEVMNRAKGDTARFNQIYESYRNARDVTTQRLYLETMEDILKNANKVVLGQDGKGGVVPYLPLDRLAAPSMPVFSKKGTAP